jgi:hypothetical protein
MFDFIESCLRHKSEMVIYEAAHAIVNMKHTTAKELAPAVSVLQLFCSSPKPTLRFAAVRTLNKVGVALKWKARIPNTIFTLGGHETPCCGDGLQSGLGEPYY